ncbi:MAG TPA: FAD-dependent oxidoreductase [Burkholderiales bacterium]|nr:FAD-dependent oxidoreductase [Burkholderiales bacterium]
MGDMKAAAYICRGCGIGERLDTAQLAAIAKKEGKIELVREHDFLCSAEGVLRIREDIDNDGVTNVLIAACSRRAKAEAFRLPGTAVARANLREGVIWCQPDIDAGRETTQEMAADYVRMGAIEARKIVMPKGNASNGQSRKVLIVGGGVSGLTAALSIAEAGYEAVVVEKDAELGGWASKLWKRAPARTPHAYPVATGMPELISKVEHHPKIKVYRSATIAETSGAPGRFAVRIATAAGEAAEEVGAIVQATGFEPYDIAKLPQLGGGAIADVVDHAALERLAAAANGGPICRPSDGAAVKSVAFIQCAGQRDETGEHLPYCSGHCCNTSIKQALYFKQAYPAVDTVILYTDLRTPGMTEDFYRSAQRAGVTFTKAKVASVSQAQGRCSIRMHDLILDEESELDADLVVLATGLVPNSGVNIELPPEEQAKTVSVLNLKYRQGKDIPQLKHGLTDSHFICFPYETRRTGIYAAGPVRRPMDMDQSIDDATGAALKAIQAVENAALGRAAHPRSGDLSYPIVRLDACTQCKRCTVECPFGAIDENEQGYPQFNESRCRRCGTCMGACPVRVISFENYSPDTVGSQIKAVDIPDEFSEKPRILVLACENDAYPALDMAGAQRKTYSAFVRIVPVRCLGSVNTIWITDALNGGWDGVMMMGCKHGDDYQCHFVKGSELASYRMGKIDDTLKQLALETERVATYEVAITDVDRVPQLIEEYVAKIVEIGPSPMKGFA